MLLKLSEAVCRQDIFSYNGNSILSLSDNNNNYFHLHDSKNAAKINLFMLPVENAYI